MSTKAETENNSLAKDVKEYAQAVKEVIMVVSAAVSVITAIYVLRDRVASA